MNCYRIVLRVVLLVYFLNTICAREHHPFVTCGTVLKLLNIDQNVRLHSHEVKYGSGSGQQSVTGVDASDDTNSYWQIRGRTGVTCRRGQPIKCGSTLRFTHVSTKRNLHSHSSYESPLSHNQEVSAFGDNGEGDSGDDWIVLCSDRYWLRAEAVQIRHSISNTYLAVSGQRYSRPIQGQAEICSVLSQGRSADRWRATEGVFVKPVEGSSTSQNESPASDSSSSEHEEL